MAPCTKASISSLLLAASSPISLRLSSRAALMRLAPRRSQKRAAAVLVVFAPPPMYPAADVAGSLAEIAGNSSKPVLVAVMGEHSIGPAVEQLRAGRIPDFRFPEPAAKSLAMLTARFTVLRSLARML